jgi:predicted nucleic acid-binding protein
VSIVVDASVCASWVLPDERDERAVELLLRCRAGASAPRLLWYEVRSVLLVAERRQRISAAQVDMALVELDRLGLAYDARAMSADVVQLARAHQISGYDAVYLELARRLSLPLATLDQALAAAARLAGCEVLPASP